MTCLDCIDPGSNPGYHLVDGAPERVHGPVDPLPATAEMERALRDIYHDARYRFDGELADGTPIRAGYCRWCGAPPPDDARDHDVACPAAKAGWALRLAGYRDVGPAIDFLRRRREALAPAVLAALDEHKPGWDR